MLWAPGLCQMPSPLERRRLRPSGSTGCLLQKARSRVLTSTPIHWDRIKYLHGCKSSSQRTRMCAQAEALRRVSEEQVSASGKVPITLRSVDRNKSDDERPNYRIRLVKEGEERRLHTGTCQFLCHVSCGSAQVAAFADDYLLKVSKKSRR